MRGVVVRMIQVRAEENAILLWNKTTSGTAYISGDELLALYDWAYSGKENGFIRRLKKLPVIHDEDRVVLLSVIESAKYKKAPLRSFCAPESLHIELTSRCHYHCPQCYKGTSQNDLSIDTLLLAIKQAHELSVFQVALGGGEPLLYPFLLDVIKEITTCGMSCSITTSGAGLDHLLLKKLMGAGLNHVQISLNGSTNEVHSRSRQGYLSGVEALHLLSHSNLSYGINWVARRDNIDDLPDMIKLAAEFGSNNINILRYKPSLKEDYAQFCLTEENLLFLESVIRKTKTLAIKLDSAFSALLCRLNGRISFFGGCGAGRRFLALDADGFYRPCSHIDQKEISGNLADTWYHSKKLLQFRTLEDHLSSPCNSCSYLDGCRGCRAIIIKGDGEFYSGEPNCINAIPM